MQQSPGERFLRLRDVIQIVGLSRTQIYRLAATRRFPPPVKLGERASAWVESEVNVWAAERIAASRKQKLA